MSVHSRARRVVPGSFHLNARAVWRFAPLGLAAVLLCGCGGGGGTDSPAAPNPATPTPPGPSVPPPAPVHYTVGGTVTGLAAGQTLVLQNQGVDDFTVGANGSFVMAASWPAGSSYAVTIKTHPTGQQCSVSQGAGTLSSTVASVRVDCVNLPAATYTLGGMASGLSAGQSVVLTNGSGEDLTVSADGGFTFTKALVDGAVYAITVKTAPAGSGCVVRNGFGSVAATSVDSVAVRCAPLATLSEGPWEQDQCLPVTGASAGLRDLWRVSRSGNSVSVGAGMVTYRSPQCDGAGTASSGPLNSTFSFEQERTEATAELAAFWGNRRYIATSMGPTKVVLVRKANHLCLLEDTATPSAFPDAASLGSAVTAAVAAGKCYTPR